MIIILSYDVVGSPPCPQQLLQSSSVTIALLTLTMLSTFKTGEKNLVYTNLCCYYYYFFFNILLYKCLFV